MLFSFPPPHRHRQPRKWAGTVLRDWSRSARARLHCLSIPSLHLLQYRTQQSLDRNSQTHPSHVSILTLQLLFRPCVLSTLATPSPPLPVRLNAIDPVWVCIVWSRSVYFQPCGQCTSHSISHCVTCCKPSGCLYQRTKVKVTGLCTVASPVSVWTSWTIHTLLYPILFVLPSRLRLFHFHFFSSSHFLLDCFCQSSPCPFSFAIRHSPSPSPLPQKNRHDPHELAQMFVCPPRTSLTGT